MHNGGRELTGRSLALTLAQTLSYPGPGDVVIIDRREVRNLIHDAQLLVAGGCAIEWDISWLEGSTSADQWVIASTGRCQRKESAMSGSRHRLRNQSKGYPGIEEISKIIWGCLRRVCRKASLRKKARHRGGLF